MKEQGLDEFSEIVRESGPAYFSRALEMGHGHLLTPGARLMVHPFEIWVPDRIRLDGTTPKNITELTQELRRELELAPSLTEVKDQLGKPEPEIEK